MPRDDSLTAEEHERERKTRHALYSAHGSAVGCISAVLQARKSWDEVPPKAQQDIYPALKALRQEHPFIHHSQKDEFDRAISECLSKLGPKAFGRLGPVQKHAVATPSLEKLLAVLEKSRTQHIAMAAYHSTSLKRLGMR